MRAKELMSQEVFTVCEDDTVEDLVQVLVGEHIHGAPVVNRRGELVGIVTQQDIFFGSMTRGESTFESKGSRVRNRLRVRDIMPEGKNPTVGGAATVREAIIVSKEFNFGAVSIVDDRGHLIGVLTDGDIGRLFKHHRDDEKLLTVLRGPVSDVMTAEPQAVEADMLGQRVVLLMEERDAGDSSRELSVSLNYIDAAILWRERDRHEKARKVARGRGAFP